MLHPLGTLRVSQRAVPLDLKIDKVGSQKPSDANKYQADRRCWPGVESVTTPRAVREGAVPRR